jgi:hypothetical protein
LRNVLPNYLCRWMSVWVGSLTFRLKGLSLCMSKLWYVHHSYPKLSFAHLYSLLPGLMHLQNKEFARRRKVADAVIAHKMDQLLLSSSENKTTAFPSFTEKLPPLSTRLYDEEVVRIWDFLHCFSAAFVTENSNNLPTIDSLQDAVDELKKGRSDSKEHQSAVALMEGIAITLCEAISPGLTKYLAAAAYISDPSNKVSSDEAAFLPVTKTTWREVARMSLIADTLIDLGYNKIESGNIVRVNCCTLQRLLFTPCLKLTTSSFRCTGIPKRWSS